MGNPLLEGLQYLQISMREKSIRNNSNILLKKRDDRVLQLQCTETPLKPYFFGQKSESQRNLSCIIQQYCSICTYVFEQKLRFIVILISEAYFCRKKGNKY